MRQHDRITLVQRLLSLRGPSAIIRAVSDVSINSLYSRFWEWLGSHVSKEVLKGAPTLAHVNPFSAVVTVVFAVWVMASLVNASPNTVLASPRQPMPNVAALPARPLADLFVTHRASTNDSNVPALALAFPVSAGLVGFNVLQHRQFAVDVPSLIFESDAAIIRLASSHLNLLHRFKVVRATSERQTPAWFVYFAPAHPTCQPESGAK